MHVFSITNLKLGGSYSKDMSGPIKDTLIVFYRHNLIQFAHSGSGCDLTCEIEVKSMMNVPIIEASSSKRPQRAGAAGSLGLYLPVRSGPLALFLVLTSVSWEVSRKSVRI